MYSNATHVYISHVYNRYGWVIVGCAQLQLIVMPTVLITGQTEHSACARRLSVWLSIIVHVQCSTCCLSVRSTHSVHTAHYACRHVLHAACSHNGNCALLDCRSAQFTCTIKTVHIHLVMHNVHVQQATTITLCRRHSLIPCALTKCCTPFKHCFASDSELQYAVQV